MLTDDFYKDILVSPAQQGDVLYIVSGYATAGMAARNMSDIKDSRCGISINLIVGMTAKDGISETNHKGFCDLTAKPPINKFQCAYVPENKNPVHTKAYAWFNGETPLCGYVGSANYTQTGFFGVQEEAMEAADPMQILAYYRAVAKTSLLCGHPDVQGLIKDDEKARFRPDADDAGVRPEESNAKTYTLLDRDGNLPRISGLNWGQRKGRNPNQAYIRVPSHIGGSGFFPPRGHHFALHTDDGQMMLCRVVQDNAKAIHSSQDNSAIGVYFRKRLGVPLGELVEKRHLEQYGRTDITFHKIDEENYLMDFSVSESLR